jgi:hypothetical protein
MFCTVLFFLICPLVYLFVDLAVVMIHHYEIQTHYYLENVVSPGIEHGSSGFVARNSDH